MSRGKPLDPNKRKPPTPYGWHRTYAPTWPCVCGHLSKHHWRPAGKAGRPGRLGKCLALPNCCDRFRRDPKYGGYH